jgi:UDP-glucose 4-epimerase
MKTLLTGGAGCIGSELAVTLINSGHNVVVYDNLSSGRIEHVAPLLDHPHFRFVEADLLDKGALERAMRDVEEVWHLAANPDVKYVPGDATDKDLQQNLIGTYNVLEAMRRAGASRLAFTSTSAVYGLSEDTMIAETSPTRPISLYGASKLACEALIGSFQHLFGMKVCIFRLANIVGAKTRKRGATVLSDFVRKLSENPHELHILGNGQQSKSYLLSSDCVEAMTFAMNNASEPVPIFNIGCSDSLSVNSIASLVVEALGLTQVHYTYTGTEGGWPGDVPRFVLDTRKINQLGWQASHTSREAIALTIHRMLALAPLDEVGAAACKQ